MDNRSVNEEDILKDYIDPQRIERAPEGFALKTMARIRIEEGTAPVKNRIRIPNLFPLITVLVGAILIVLVVLAPEKDTGSLFGRFAEKLGIDSLALPTTGIDLLTSLNIPSLVLYVTTGIIILALFDGLLSFFFHRIRK
ncbi:MAG TPA: hypothetical protein VK861_11680 [Bacteroidales bacterium]|nr:hypothetical protein [Bacteroidales bacterium]